MRVRNFAATYEPLNIFKKLIFILTQKSPPIETLCCKNHKNPSYRKSHTWAPLMFGCTYVLASSVLEMVLHCQSLCGLVLGATLSLAVKGREKVRYR
jgi:hypothetical protein